MQRKIRRRLLCWSWLLAGFFFVFAGYFRLASAQSSSRAVKKDPRPNVIIISIDTLRADHLGCYGYSRNTSPNLDALAEQSTVFENCFSHSSWTPVSVGSLFTSLYPEQHGSFGKDHISLPEANLTMAEIFAAAGYYCLAFSASPFIHPDFGFGQGFHEFFFDDTQDAARLAEKVKKRLGKEPGARPLFIYIMFFDPHFSYDPPREFKTMFRNDPEGNLLWEERKVARVKTLFELGATVSRDTYEYLKSMYDGEIVYTDRAVGELARFLEKRGLLSGSILVITSDHGEEFLEHGGFGHGENLYDEALRVPLLIRGKGVPEGKRVSCLVRQVDLLPTLLERAGIEAPRGMEGQSLVPLFQGPCEDRTLFGQLHPLFHGYESMAALREGILKIIVSSNPDRVELYDLAEKYPEQNNLAHTRPEMLKAMLQRLNDFESRLHPGPAKTAAVTTPPPQTRKLLKSLGYIGR